MPAPRKYVQRNVHIGVHVEMIARLWRLMTQFESISLNAAMQKLLAKVVGRQALERVAEQQQSRLGQPLQQTAPQVQHLAIELGQLVQRAKRDSPRLQRRKRTDFRCILGRQIAAEPLRQSDQRLDM